MAAPTLLELVHEMRSACARLLSPTEAPRYGSASRTAQQSDEHAARLRRASAGQAQLALCGRKTRRLESSRSNLVVLAFLGVVLKPAVDKRPPVEALGQIGCSLKAFFGYFLGPARK